MSAVYPLAIDMAISALIGGQTALGPIKAVMVDATFTYDPIDTLLTDITGVIGTAVTVNVAGINDGALSVSPFSFTGVPEGDTVRGVVFYLNANHQLLCHVDHRADTTPINVDTDGGNITFTFDRLLRL